VYLDSHCHVDRYRHPRAVLTAAARAAVVTVAVTNTPADFKRLRSVDAGEAHMRLALGLHPLAATRATEHDLSLFARLLDETDYVGEVGLDYSVYGRPSRQRQTQVFERILAIPAMRQKVLTVHSRQAEADTVRLLIEARVSAILHWYLGALKHLDAALDAGMRFSVNLAMLSTRRGQRVVAALPRERVLTETDGPFTQHRGRPSEPRDVPVLVAAIAKLWNDEPQAVGRQLFENMAVMHTEATGAQGRPALTRPVPIPPDATSMLPLDFGPETSAPRPVSSPRGR
jgi:TatD DNase family protein